MGFYLRKSLRVGPIRFNLSKSGIGVSAGIKGFRVGTGPRGNYIHMGRGGIYYRKTFAHSSKTDTPSPQEYTPPATTHTPMEEVESGNVLHMTDSSSAELLTELNSKRKKWRIWPATAIISILTVVIAASNNLPIWLTILILVFLLGLTIFAYYRDQLAKSTVLFYKLDSAPEKDYQSFHSAFDELKSCNKIWHIEAQGDVTDRKYHAGASTLIKRKLISLTKGQPPFVKTNISVPTIPVGRQKLYFFPDRLLVFDTNGVGAVGYEMLKINVSETRFIEDEGVPRDSQIVDKTWKYVNKKGGPDKRFKDNREIPIALYEEIHFASSSGLNELIQLSRVGFGTNFKETVICLQPQPNKSDDLK